MPIIPVKLKGKEWVEFQAFVDSGAGYSIFMFDIADVLGIALEKGNKEYVKIGDGSFIEVFTFKLPVIIADKEFESKIGFSRGLGVGFNVIGRQDVFHNFKVCFDDSENSVEFMPK